MAELRARENPGRAMARPGFSVGYQLLAAELGRQQAVGVTISAEIVIPMDAVACAQEGPFVGENPTSGAIAIGMARVNSALALFDGLSYNGSEVHAAILSKLIT